MTLQYSVTHPRVYNRLTAYRSLAKRMGLRISMAKTVTMSIGNTAEFSLDGTKLAQVTRFEYLGSYVTSDCSTKQELASCIQATSCAFGRLRRRVFDSHHLTVATKVATTNVSSLFYCTEVKHGLFCTNIKSGSCVQFNNVICD